MITGDMLTFGIIYSIILFGFSQSFYFLHKGSPDVEKSLYSTYSSTWMALFQITLGDYDVRYRNTPQLFIPSYFWEASHVTQIYAWLPRFCSYGGLGEIRE